MADNFAQLRQLKPQLEMASSLEEQAKVIRSEFGDQFELFDDNGQFVIKDKKSGEEVIAPQFIGPPDTKGTKPFDQIGLRMAGSFATSPEEAITYFKKRRPELEFSLHGPLNRMVWKDTSGDNSWHYVDPTGPIGGGGVKEAVADLGEFAGDLLPAAFGTAGAVGGVALAAPSAVATGPIGPVAGGVGGAGLGTAIGTGGNRLIARALGVNQELDTSDLGDVALAGALGAAAEGAAPYLAQGAKAAGRLAAQGAKKYAGTVAKAAEQVANDVSNVAGPVGKAGRTYLKKFGTPQGPGLPIGGNTAAIGDLAAGRIEMPYGTRFLGGAGDIDTFNTSLSRLVDTYIDNPMYFEESFNAFAKEYNLTPAQVNTLREEVAAGVQLTQEAIKRTGKKAAGLVPREVPYMERQLGEVYPQGTALRGQNIQRLIDSFDAVDSSLITPIEEQVKKTQANMQRFRGLSPEQAKREAERVVLEAMPRKGAKLSELQQSLKKQFEIDTEDFLEAIGISYDEIIPELQKVPFAQPLKDKLKASAQLIADQSGNPNVRDRVAAFIKAVDGITDMAGVNELKRNYPHLFRDSDDVVNSQLRKLYQLIDPTVEDALKRFGIDDDIMGALVSTNKTYSQFKDSFDKVLNLIDAGNTKEGIVMLEQLLLGRNKFLTALQAKGDARLATEYYNNTIRLAMRALLADMRARAINGQTVNSDAFHQLAHKTKGMPELRKMMEFLASEIDNFGLKHIGTALGGMEGLEKGLAAEAGQFGFQGNQPKTRTPMQWAKKSLTPLGVLPITTGELKSSLYSPAPLSRRVAEQLRKTYGPPQEGSKNPPMALPDIAESNLAAKVKELLSKKEKR